MRECNEYISPLKTREIADSCGISVYLTLYYLRKLNRLCMVKPVRNDTGIAILGAPYRLAWNKTGIFFVSETGGVYGKIIVHVYS